MEHSDILEKLFDDKILKIMRLFYKHYDKDFYMREIAAKSGVALASTFRLIDKLVDLKLVDIRRINKFKFYRLADNEHTRLLGSLIKKERQALEVFIARAKNIKGLQSIILQGKEQRDSANLILIGEKIPQAELKSLCATMREEYKFKITPLILGEEQFEQMMQMGLIKEKTRVLYEK